MPLDLARMINIPGSAESAFDHGAYEPRTRRVFVAHTGKNRVEVLASETTSHTATLDGFPHAAGVVADDGHVLVTNRGSASLAWLDAESLKPRAVIQTGPLPNGVALVAQSKLAIVACIGDESAGPTLHCLSLGTSNRWSIELPGRPRWCVTDAAGTKVFLAVREPSMVLVAELPSLGNIQRWMLPCAGAHGIDIDHSSGLLYVACDAGALLEIDTATGKVINEWPLAGAPDATFFNPASGLVHVAIGKPGLVQTIAPRTSKSIEFATAAGAKTTALVPPDRLYVFSPHHQSALVLSGA
jgi:DNA-binding beta-propeller fold protein YncE